MEGDIPDEEIKDPRGLKKAITKVAVDSLVRDFYFKRHQKHLPPDAIEAVEVESRKRDIVLRTVFAVAMLIIFGGAVASSIFIIFEVGYGNMSLNDNVLLALVGATVAEIAGLLIFAAKYLFPSP